MLNNIYYYLSAYFSGSVAPKHTRAHLNILCSEAQVCCITAQTHTLCNKHRHQLPAVTDVAVTGENEFRIVSELSRELIVAWPLFMKRIKAKRLVFLVTISQQR